MIKIDAFPTHLQQLGDVLLLPLEERGVPNQPVLDDFANPRLQLTVWEGLESVGVNEDTIRLVESSNHVLAKSVVHPSLAAHRAVHHGHHRGRNLNEIHATLVGRRRVANHIPNHAAAKGHKGALPVEAVLQGLVIDQVQGGQVLVLLGLGVVCCVSMKIGGLVASRLTHLFTIRKDARVGVLAGRLEDTLNPRKV